MNTKSKVTPADAAGRPLAETHQGTPVYTDTPEYTRYVDSRRIVDGMKAVLTTFTSDGQVAGAKAAREFVETLPEAKRQYDGEQCAALAVAVDQGDANAITLRLRFLSNQVSEATSMLAATAGMCPRPPSPETITVADRRHPDHPQYIGRSGRGWVSKT